MIWSLCNYFLISQKTQKFNFSSHDCPLVCLCLLNLVFQNSFWFTTIINAEVVGLFEWTNYSGSVKWVLILESSHGDHMHECTVCWKRVCYLWINMFARFLLGKKLDQWFFRCNNNGQKWRLLSPNAPLLHIASKVEQYSHKVFFTPRHSFKLLSISWFIWIKRPSNTSDWETMICVGYTLRQKRSMGTWKEKVIRY